MAMCIAMPSTSTEMTTLLVDNSLLPYMACIASTLPSLHAKMLAVGAVELLDRLPPMKDASGRAAKLYSETSMKKSATQACLT